MQHKRLKSGAFVLLVSALTATYAQESVNATGGKALGSGGSVSYSVGQVVYTTNVSDNGSVTPGVQQSYKISVLTALDEAKGITLKASAYPNPTTNYLIVEVNNLEIKDLYFELYEMSGKLLQNEKITGEKTSIAMNHLIPATYFVKIIWGNKEAKTFKIIKY